MTPQNNSVEYFNILMATRPGIAILTYISLHIQEYINIEYRISINGLLTFSTKNWAEKEGL